MYKNIWLVFLLMTTAFAFEQNQPENNVISLIDGMLEYKIIKEGQGQTVQSYNTPLVRYKGHFLNGDFFQSDDEPMLISLEEAVPGLQQGILGMREGEVRVLYVHPELGYETTQNLHPSEPLVFEIEVIQADVSTGAHFASPQKTLPFLIDSTHCMSHCR